MDKKEILKICKYVHSKQVEKISKALQTVADNEKSTIYIGGIGKEIGVNACKTTGFNFINLATITQAYNNLPCLGLAYMGNR